MIDINHWKSDTYVDVILAYNISIRALSPSGEILASHAVETDENLKGKVANPPKYAKTAIPAAFKKALEALLNHGPVVAVLGTSAPAVGGSPP